MPFLADVGSMSASKKCGADCCETDCCRLHRKTRGYCNCHITFAYSFCLSSAMSHIETIDDSVGTEEGVVEFYNAEEDLEDFRQHTVFDLNELTEAIKIASEGALTSKTVTTYRKYYDSFTSN
jgi:hypothetical protein